jgi:heme exporter protein D
MFIGSAELSLIFPLVHSTLMVRAEMHNDIKQKRIRTTRMQIPTIQTSCNSE